MKTPGSLTKCILQLRQSCSAPGSTYSGGIDLPKLGYELTEHVPAAAATHVVFTKR